MEGFYITISNGLLADGHRKRMGAAVWEFMWLLDKVTMIDEDGTGWVLGKKPINLADLALSFDYQESTISENLTKLEQGGYIERIHTPHGIVLGVRKCTKRFGQKPKPNSEKPKRNIRQDNRQSSLDKSEWSLSETLQRWESGPDRRFDVLAWFIKKKGLKPASKEELNNIKDRYLKVSAKLTHYKDEQLVAAAKKCQELADKLDFDWGLDTVLKQLTK